MDYKVVPFVESLDLKNEKRSHVSNQLEILIKEYSNQGWEYVRLESVTTIVKPDMGCFGLGAKPGYTIYSQMVVFKR